MVEVGFYSLCLGLCFAFYGMVMGLYSLHNPNIGVVSSARNALIAVFICVLLTSFVMWNSIFFHDFSVKYVYEHSSIDMPPLYLFTSFWSALEGSHLLWTLIMSLVVTLSLVTVKRNNFSLYPALCVAYGCSLSFMLLLTITFSAPLTRLFPVGTFGQGMNALLQNPYMAIHPPMLFTGYCLLIVPFAYSFAALVRGGFTTDWLMTVRKWALLAWAVLTIAIFLGGKWAYVELGWAGYWAWDPVENSSFMPWLALTAGLHTLLVTDKTGRLPRMMLFLFMFSYALTFQGTFITRSGVISSVHSFAESDIGPTYLLWVCFLVSISIAMVFTRGNRIQGAAKSNEWRVSKESALLFTNFFLLFLLALVFIGTLLPLIVEATRGIKISIQQPFFNAFAPWIGLSLVSLLGVGNLMRWKNGKIEDPITCLLFPLLWSVAITLALAKEKNFDLKSSIIFLLVIWTCGILIMDLIYKLKALRWNGKILLKYNRPYVGALIIHIGFLFAIAGFAGNYRGISAEANLNLNESTYFNGYTIVNKGLNYNRNYNAQYVIANIESIDTKNGENNLINPMRSKFTNNEQWFNEIGIQSNFWHDLYIVLASFDVNNQSVSLKMSFNPTVKFVWTSLVIMVLGAIISLTHRKQKRSIEVDAFGNIQGNQETLEDILQEAIERSPINAQFAAKVVSSFIILLAITITLFGISGVAHANQVQPTQLNPLMEDVAKELRCPTCQGVSILESGTLQSIAMRTEIEKQLLEGKTKPEIIKYFKDSYGTWILREPDAHSALGLFIWAVPIVGFILGPLFIIFALRNSRKRQEKENMELFEEIHLFIQKKKAEVKS
ncbi:cytochrome c-type biogenesis CcmF C-terminal domain-containing protein [Fluviispira sanaruensis]|uniref:Cytochrome c-type biogenesis protein n=1 Tax=Fluviispira sanaruensis TaxID=2493639 RepID=A0A4P2VT24_FLUSA|nr:cytochrome c-type biogenesis CcmF C-terminal domain-containing protein [Fluviispira sanaruensis]BBH52475.1 cytochrome c-type biogenesis protein CcmF [Fluviispira sanaruensis]